MALGKWASLDIETTGIDPSGDHIIDIGFLLFENTKLVREFQSLVASPVPLSQFIQDLTGITDRMLANAPQWLQLHDEFVDLEGATIIAHNASFEASFLESKLPPCEFVDSIPLFGILLPTREKLGLEGILQELGLAEVEVHRGFEDARDLIRALISATKVAHHNSELKDYLGYAAIQLGPDHKWIADWLSMSESSLHELEDQFELSAADQLQVHLPKNLPDRDEVEFGHKGIQLAFKDRERWEDLIEGYEARTPQIEMALRVGQSLAHGVNGSIQAPTGTGKSMAYLVPSALYSKSGEQVLISTGSKALQTQLITKDIPLLEHVLGETSDTVRLVGSKNHYCEVLWSQNGPAIDLVEDRSLAQAILGARFAYNRGVGYDEMVGREQLPRVLFRAVEGMGQVDRSSVADFRSCTFRRCPQKDHCRYFQGLEKAKEAKIIVGNHALLLHWPNALERPRHIIVDEAHKLESEATRAYALRGSASEFEQFLKALIQGNGLGALFYLLENREQTGVVDGLRELSEYTSTILQDHLNGITEDIETLAKLAPRFTEEYWNELPMVTSGTSTDAGQAVYRRLESITFVLEQLFNALVPHSESYKPSQLEGMELEAYTRFESFYSTLSELVVVLQTALGEDQEYARSLRYHARDGWEVCSSAIHVGKRIFEELLSPSRSVLFTSATLANHDGSRGEAAVEWVTGLRYLDSSRRYRSGLYLDGAIDYESRAPVWMIEDAPKIWAPDYVDFMMEVCVPMIRERGGKTLFLMSSRVRFEVARELLLKEFSEDFPVYYQGQSASVVDEFKSNGGNGVLIGMESFSEGIDIPGDALTLVVIDKVPDLPMELVIQKRRDAFEQEFGSEFSEYYLANRARLLQQKCGRLLRRPTDRGHILVFDSRLSRWKSRTWNEFCELMRPYQLRRIKSEQVSDDLELRV